MSALHAVPLAQFTVTLPVASVFALRLTVPNATGEVLRVQAGVTVALTPIVEVIVVAAWAAGPPIVAAANAAAPRSRVVDLSIVDLLNEPAERRATLGGCINSKAYHNCGPIW